MIEFGEKLKTAREEKGMTQQTLANGLYVTRQAVSRWECGARYPDLLTAKKLSEILDVSLDELLSGEETTKYTSDSPIAESTKIGRTQSALYAFVGMAYLLISILSIGLLFPISDETVLIISAYSIFYIMRDMLITVLLFYGLMLSIKGNLTQKKAGLISSAYFLTALFSNLFIHAQVGLLLPTLLQTCIYFICAAVVLNCFYHRNHFTPVPVYCISALCLIKTAIAYMQAFQFYNELSFVIRTIGLAAVAGLMVLISYQSYILSQRSRHH